VTLLKVEDLRVSYGHIQAVQGISFEVGEGEIVAIIGANGAGKTTTLHAISRVIPAEPGSTMVYMDKNLFDYPPHLVVPEGRHIFGSLTVMENLRLATYGHRRDKEGIEKDFERVFALFPRLAERKKQSGDTLSGGEQQMLAVGRALMSRSKLMLLDEPSMGLAPLLMQDLFRVLREINEEGTTILLVEQNARMALQFARRGYVLEAGRIVLEGPCKELATNPRVEDAYLGG